MNPSFCQAVDGDRSSKPVNEPSLRQTLERSEPDLDAPAQTLRRGIVYAASTFAKSIVLRSRCGVVTSGVLLDNAQRAHLLAVAVRHLEPPETLCVDAKPREQVRRRRRKRAESTVRDLEAEAHSVRGGCAQEPLRAAVRPPARDR